MSVKEVLQLGVKGSDMILKALKDINDKKDKFKKPSLLSLGIKGNLKEIDKKIRELFKKPVEFPLNPKPGEEKEPEKKEGKGIGKYTKDVTSGLATLSAGSALRGVASLMGAIPMIGDGLVHGANSMIDATQAFKQNITNAAHIYADTQATVSRSRNIIEGGGENAHDFVGRVDIDMSTRRALVEELGAKYGIVQKPLQDSIKKLFTTTEGKPADVGQAAAIAGGNFAALGTDTGFFMQKLSDQLQGLPPTIKQSMMAPFIEQASKEKRFEQFDFAAKQNVTTLDNLERETAEKKMQTTNGYSPIKQVEEITAGLNLIDETLNKGFSNLIGGITELVKTSKGNITATDFKHFMDRIQGETRKRP